VLTYGRNVQMSLAAARELEADGIDAEIIDLRSLHPYDWDAITASVRKTNRVLCVNEDTEITNFGEHLARRTTEALFEQLSLPPALHAGAHLPGIGLAETLESASVPTLASVTEAIARAARAPARRTRPLPSQSQATALDGNGEGLRLSPDSDAFDFREALTASLNAR
jgi:2-oxoisovalerate dehydrogenase E1 component beta subunit